MRLLRVQETVVVSKRTSEKVMDQSEGQDAKRPALPQRQQQQQQQTWPPPQQQPPAPYGLRPPQQQQQHYVPQQPSIYAQQYPSQIDVAPALDPYQRTQQQLLFQQQQPPPPQQQYFPPQAYAAPAQALFYQQQQQLAAVAAAAGAYPAAPPPPAAPYLQPKVGRLPADRPLMKLSVSLIDTYKHINTVYYEERDARRAARAKEKATKGQGANNNGWDDENYDYIVTPGELFYGRYKMMERIGKGSFGQVVRAEDVETKREVAIKIIKSKKPFLMQAKTEIELLTHLFEKDPQDQHNLGKSVTL